MASRVSNLNPFASGANSTLDRIAEVINTDPSITSRQRADLLSALRTVGRAIALPLDAIPAHPAFLRPRLTKVKPARLGISAARWANVRSLLQTALALADVPMAGRTYLAPLSADWEALAALLPKRVHRPATLGQFQG